MFFGSSPAGIREHLSGDDPVFVVYDRNARAHAAEIISAMKAESELALDVSEDSKTVSTVTDICSWLLGNGADRNAVLLAVGGGILTDMAGFAAAIYKRGIRAVYVPTTLLSQVDASVGGKTGVNYDSYKNMLGVIRQPEFTYICPEVLESLPLRDFLSGAAEMVKTFLIEDGGWYGKSVRFLSDLHAAVDKQDFLRRNRPALLELIHAAASVKAGVVSRDQFETGERRKLNLGHTFAHAIEKNARKNGDDITHGEAVSVGIVMAAELSERTGLAPHGFASRLAGELERAGLPVKCPYPVRSLAEAMSRDKKAEDGIIHFVLLSGPGDVRIVDMTVSEAARILA